MTTATATTTTTIFSTTVVSSSRISRSRSHTALVSNIRGRSSRSSRSCSGEAAEQGVGGFEIKFLSRSMKISATGHSIGRRRGEGGEFGSDVPAEVASAS